MDIRGFIYQEHRRFFAVVNEGLEELAGVPVAIVSVGPGRDQTVTVLPAFD